MRSAAVVVFLILAADAERAMAIETTDYHVERSFADFELRDYPGYIVAETQVSAPQAQAGNQAFAILAGYIFGKNADRKSIQMTAPVTQSAGTRIAMTSPVTQSEAGEGMHTVQFMMPSDYALATLPVPLDERVTLKQVPPRRMAALRYSGTWSQANYEQHLALLRAAMTREGLSSLGPPIWARYNPPWTPWFLRRNEVMIPIATR